MTLVVTNADNHDLRCTVKLIRPSYALLFHTPHISAFRAAKPPTPDPH